MRGISLPLAALICLAHPGMGAAAGQQPFELVRELQVFQNEAALGASDARAERRARIAVVAAQLARFETGVWAEPRNARAAVVYVLSGGDPGVLRKLVASKVSLGVDEKLVKGALAYGDRRDEEATELLDGVDIDQLDRSIGGHVALVRALLVANSDDRKAFALFDKARILAPGTIVEEAALRRQAVMAAKMGELDLFESLSSQYFRRFSGSIFVRSFEVQFAHEAVAHGYGGDAKRAAKLETLLRALSAPVRVDTCLVLAEEGIAVANVAIVRLSARVAAIDAKAQPLDATRMRLFEASVAILTPDYDAGAQALLTIDRARLGVREEALLDAALFVARQIAKPPVAPPGQAGAPTDNAESGEPDDATMTTLISNAEQAMARVDGYLSEDTR